MPDSQWSTSRRTYVLTLLCLATVFNYIDRYLPSILLEAIKTDLRVSDTAMGLLTGTAFSICYVVAGFPIARWADRSNRRSIIAVCLTIWSGMTALSGLAQNYFQLAIARAGVAIGESGAVPATQSLLSDLYPASKRATAIGIVTASGAAGIGFGLFFGGWLNETFDWRVAFFVVGIPGVLLALLIRFTVSEPVRGMSDPGASTEAIPLRQALSLIWKIPSFRLILLIALMTAFASYGMIAWSPAYLMRIHGMSTAEAGLWLGIATILGTGGGNLLAGFLADRLGSRDVRWYAGVAGLGVLASAPFGIAFALAGNGEMAIFCYILAQLLKSLWLAPTYGMALNLAPPGMRAMTSAILTAVVNLGLGLGPLAIGMMNDAFSRSMGEAGIRYSLMISMGGLVVAGIAALCLARRYKIDLAAVTSPSTSIPATS